MAKGTLQIDLLGTSFTIQAEEDSIYLERLLTYYRHVVSQIEETTHLHDPLRISILAGIMLCDEIQKDKKRFSRNDGQPPSALELAEAERLTLKMIERINTVLK